MKRIWKALPLEEAFAGCVADGYRETYPYSSTRHRYSLLPTSHRDKTGPRTTPPRKDEMLWPVRARFAFVLASVTVLSRTAHALPAIVDDDNDNNTPTAWWIYA